MNLRVERAIPYVIINSGEVGMSWKSDICSNDILLQALLPTIQQSLTREPGDNTVQIPGRPGFALCGETKGDSLLMSITFLGRVIDLFAVCGCDEDTALWADMIRFFERMWERPLPLEVAKQESVGRVGSVPWA